jgi:hypothetical protein
VNAEDGKQQGSQRGQIEKLKPSGGETMQSIMEEIFIMNVNGY